MTPAKSRGKSKRSLLYRRKFSILAGVLLIVFCFTSREAKAIRMLAPTWFGMEQIAPLVFVDEAMPETERQRMLSLMIPSEERLTRYYGGVMSRPKVLFFWSQERFEAFGGSAEAGKAYSSYAVMIAPRGLSLSILTHERSHAELFARVGFLAWLGLPQWFDDGLAVVISEEPRHSEEVYERARSERVPQPKLSELHSGRQWSRAMRKHHDPRLNPHGHGVVYATAGHEVRGWLEKTGAPGLRKLLRDLAKGEAFSAAYTNALRP